MIDEWPRLERRISSMQLVYEKTDNTLQVEAMEEGEEGELLSGQPGGEDGDLLDGFEDLDVLSGFGDDESPSPPNFRPPPIGGNGSVAFGTSR